MWRVCFFAAFLACLQTAAMAQTRHAGCTPGQAKVVDAAIASAKDLTLRAAVAVGHTPDYQRWFGTYSQANAERVRASLKSLVTALRTGVVTAQCDAARDDGCNGGEYAWVYANAPYLIHLCPAFFTLPPLSELRPGERRSENGTREGTIVHEVSHFIHVASTEDHCYSRDICSRMAQRDPRRAIENADSYQYFTEDVTYFARQSVTNKPRPASR